MLCSISPPKYTVLVSFIHSFIHSFICVSKNTIPKHAKSKKQVLTALANEGYRPVTRGQQQQTQKSYNKKKTQNIKIQPIHISKTINNKEILTNQM